MLDGVVQDMDGKLSNDKNIFSLTQAPELLNSLSLAPRLLLPSYWHLVQLQMIQ